MLDWLDRLERRLAAGDDDDLAVALVALAAAGGQEVPVPDGERHAAGRRALLLLATGGDPARGLDLSGRAVTALAVDLETDDRRALLMYGLRSLFARTGALPHVHQALHALVDEPDIAWRAYAASILAEELEDED